MTKNELRERLGRIFKAEALDGFLNRPNPRLAGRTPNEAVASASEEDLARLNDLVALIERLPLEEYRG